MPDPDSRYLLYADDDPDDHELLGDIMRSLDPEMGLQFFQNGLELMQFLEALRPGDLLPCLVILDINMPIWDGLQTLETIRKIPVYSHLTVLLYTTSSSDRDAKRALELGAQAVLRKPVSHEEFEEMAKRFSSFCREAVTVKKS